MMTKVGKSRLSSKTPGASGSQKPKILGRSLLKTKKTHARAWMRVSFFFSSDCAREYSRYSLLSRKRDNVPFLLHFLTPPPPFVPFDLLVLWLLKFSLLRCRALGSGDW